MTVAVRHRRAHKKSAAPECCAFIYPMRSTAIRVVRVVVDAVWYAVVVAVTAAVGAVTVTPAAAIEFPAVPALRPDWTGIGVTRAGAFPVTLGPYVAAA